MRDRSFNVFSPPPPPSYSLQAQEKPDCPRVVQCLHISLLLLLLCKGMHFSQRNLTGIFRGYTPMELIVCAKPQNLRTMDIILFFKKYV